VRRVCFSLCKGSPKVQNSASHQGYVVEVEGRWLAHIGIDHRVEHIQPHSTHSVKRRREAERENLLDESRDKMDLVSSPGMATDATTAEDRADVGTLRFQVSGGTHRCAIRRGGGRPS
jgi:hypothetical protein